MTLTALDARTALIVVDLQRGLRHHPTIHPMDAVVARAAELAAAFRAQARPVVLVTVAGGAPGRTDRPRAAFVPSAGFAELLPELDRQPDDISVVKHSPGAFATTDLQARLQALGVTQVAIVGIATSNGVESTARQAYELGFNVTLVTDAMTDTDPDAHAHSLARVFPRIAETATTAELMAALGA